MNIFLDKSLPKSTQIILQIVRVAFFVAFFGGIFFFGNNELFSDILVGTGVLFIVVYTIIKIIVARKKKRENSITNI
ncbi:MAG TPA: hypothetical protein VHB70_20235 [Parafilimonas sp.]|nr:hypothetical protein [Parafilimonas sp.]